MRPVQPGDIAIIIASKNPSHIGREVFCCDYPEPGALWTVDASSLASEVPPGVICISAPWLGLTDWGSGYAKLIFELVRRDPDDEELDDREKSVKKPISLPEI